MRWGAVAVLAVLLAGCSSQPPLPPEAGGPAPVESGPVLGLACPECRLTFAVNANPYVHQVAAHPTDPNRAAAAVLNILVDPNSPSLAVPPFISPASIAVTTDDGKTWTSTALSAAPGEGTPEFAAVAWGEKGDLWAAAVLTSEPVVGLGGGIGVGTTGSLAVYRSLDDGQTWSRMATFDNGGGYGNIAVIDGTTYVTSVGIGGHIAWSSDDGATWNEAGVDARCFSLSKVARTKDGLQGTCTYPFGTEARETASFTFDPVAKNADMGPALACDSGGPAVDHNGRLVAATACDGVVTFHALEADGWQALATMRFGTADDGYGEQSPLVVDSWGTLHVLVQAGAGADFGLQETVTTVHIWLGTDGVVGSEVLAVAADSTTRTAATSHATPSLDGGAGLWLLASVQDGILATRFADGSPKA